ncbi:hypothetical protein PPL_05828 [Heterostelium album PN500]|uniref:Uncharacterized protein n=1 Tax=Heterostelium pallidum (strain ATCC 26659 / Pp 5 / PN500) TaxID=670386 RepID=D3BBG0_HETP5|nr:hypothetical protein PPL_05828 [Heterostelium album PN500]EFA80993.1 hypothetical protein PPL_05828 [Heterostelium album PN500]|eukprot:XP_020433111.1 hypothetical protein PPL_05828 [Heterostelium album PN500]
MTVLVENKQQNGASASTTELELKVFKVLAAFSQSIEKSLITSQTNINDMYKTLNCPLPQSPELKQLNQITDTGNIGLLTIQMVRTVIQRSEALSKQISTLNTTVKNNNINLNNNNSNNNNSSSSSSNAEIKAYKMEIESLKKKITRLQQTTPSSSSSSTTTTTTTSTSTANNTITKSTSNNHLNEESTTSNSNRSSKDHSSESLSSLRNEVEISHDPMMDDELIETPREDSILSSTSSSSAAHASTEMHITNGHASISSGSSPIVTPPTISANDKTLSSSGSFTSQAHSPLTHSASSTSILGNSSPSSSSTNLAYGDSPSRQSSANLGNSTNAAPKKAYLTDLLDQIDLENNTPSKDKKKGKFKFF